MPGALAGTLAVVRGIAPPQLAAPTPCTDFDVRALLNHLMGVFMVAGTAGGKAAEVDPATFAEDRTGGDWLATFEALAEAARLAWVPAAAWQGHTAVFGRAFPAAVAGRMLISELVVHGWDLARATRQPYRPDADAVRVVHRHYSSTLVTQRTSAWGPPVPVPPSAPVLDRALGLSGRDPGWRPLDADDRR